MTYEIDGLTGAEHAEFFGPDWYEPDLCEECGREPAGPQGICEECFYAGQDEADAIDWQAEIHYDEFDCPYIPA